MTDPATEVADSTAEPDEPSTTRAILRKGDAIQFNGAHLTLAMNVVVEGKRSDILTAGLKPE